MNKLQKEVRDNFCALFKYGFKEKELSSLSWYDLPRTRMEIKRCLNPELFCSNGMINYYRVTESLGQLGSRKEDTWDKQNDQHSCCKSKVAWRHKISCLKLIGNKKWQELENNAPNHN